MKITRSYASPNEAVDVKKFLQRLIELELDKIANTKHVNPPASHTKITLGGDCA